MLELLKKIEALEKRIKELESQKKNNLGMFGRTYDLIGNSNSDTVINTRGQVKVKIGNKFIDLIKDGKINCDSKFIYCVNDVTNIGNKEGIYYVTSNGLIYIKIKNQPILPIGGEQNADCVSYNIKQLTTPELKNTALVNIGLICERLSDLSKTDLQNGFVYVIEDNNIYVVLNGIPSRLEADFPSQVNKQITINTKGKYNSALSILGQGKLNGISIGDLSNIYENNRNFIIDSTDSIKLYVGESVIMSIDKNNVTAKSLLADTVSSQYYDNAQGYRIIKDSNNKYILNIDKVVERDVLKMSIYSESTIITNSVSLGDGKFELETKSNSFLKDDKVVLISSEKLEGQILENKGFTPNFINSIFVQFDSSVRKVTNGILYLLERRDSSGLIIKPIIIDTGNLYSTGSIDYTLADIIIGNLSNISIKNDSGNSETVIGHGIYSKLGVFDKLAYSSNYNLSELDYSSNIASTEWVKNLTKTLNIPKGIICLYGATTLPEGWQLCDGQNGTPDLSLNTITVGELILRYIIKM